MTASPPMLRDRAVRLMAVGEATADGAEWEVLRVGPVVDPDGTLVVDITAELAQAFADGVNAQVAAGLDIPIDFSHESERADGDGSHATLGVVTGARFDAETGRVYATKRLNALGRARLAADVGEDGKGVSLRTSPTLRVRPLSHPSEPGKVIATAWMSSLAVTDRPRQNGLAAISLSRDGVTTYTVMRIERDGVQLGYMPAGAQRVEPARRLRGQRPELDIIDAQLALGISLEVAAGAIGATVRAETVDVRADALLARYEGPDGSEAAHRQALAAACAAALQARGLYPSDDGYMSVVDWSTEAAIVEVWVEDAGCTLYRIPYTEADDAITTGAPELVERRVIYESKQAATVAVQMSRPSGASAGGATVANEPQATNETTPGTDAPAPDKVTLAQVREERDALRLARDEAVAEATALKAELAQVKAGASSLERTVDTLRADIDALQAEQAKRAKAEAEATFDAAWKACLSKSAVIADHRDAWKADFDANPDTTLRCLSRLAPGAAGITLGAPAGSPGEAADAQHGADPAKVKAAAVETLNQTMVTLAAEKKIGQDEALRLIGSGQAGVDALNTYRTVYPQEAAR